jgi:hypothetical protein
VDKKILNLRRHRSNTHFKGKFHHAIAFSWITLSRNVPKEPIHYSTAALRRALRSPKENTRSPPSFGAPPILPRPTNEREASGAG